MDYSIKFQEEKDTVILMIRGLPARILNQILIF